MNKKIIAIAIATAMAAPAAMADLKVSGALGAALTFSDTDTTTAKTADDATASSREMGDNGLSKIVFDGTSGNAFARLGIDTRSIMGGKGAGAALNGRAFYAGYKLSGMSVSFGRMGAALAGLEGDKYNATFLEMRKTAAESCGDPKTESTVCNSFTASPVIQIAGKAGAIAYKVQLDVTDNTITSGGQGHFAASIKGKAGSVAYFAGYNNGTGEENAATAASAGANADGTYKGTAAVAGDEDNKDSNMKLGASMKFGKVKATLMYMANDNDGVDTTSTTVFADMGMGNGLSAGIAYGMKSSDAATDGDTFTRVAFTKSLNKGAKLFGGATIKGDDSAGTDATVFGIGMAVKF